MKLKTKILLLASSCPAVLPLSAGVVFSNNFEDGNLDPEIGTWTFAADSASTSVVPTAVAGDATLGNEVGLIDQDTGILGLELGLTSTVPITTGYSVKIDFDFAARRTVGNSKTIFVDALDSNGDIVVRLVMGDSNAFGNGGNDRQRPGYDPTSTGAANTANSLFPAPSTPTSFWWGSDGSPATFDVIRDAHLSLTISASSFDFSSTRAAGANYSATGLDNRDGGTYADIASLEFSSVGTNYGFYIDNLVVEGVPEPSSAALLGLAGLGFLARRKR
ncbi:PEP-CTERM sorting domain-containing protein [Verrucomicrobiaceae bacterium 227]